MWGLKPRPSGRSFWHAKNAAFADPHETPTFKLGLWVCAAFLSYLVYNSVQFYLV